MWQKNLRNFVGLLFLVSLVVCLESQAVVGPCTEGTWTDTLTDSRGQTTYTVTAPCVVEPNVEFDIVVTATDNTWLYANVGATWAILDNGSSLVEGFWITTVDGKWSYTKKHTISSSPNEHTIAFRYRDFGDGQSGMGWDPTATISGITTLRSNLPPVVDAGNSFAMRSEDQLFTTIAGKAVDPEGSALTYQWLEGETELTTVQALNADGTAPLNLGDFPFFSIGEHTFTLRVSDGEVTVTDTVTVTIENSAPNAAINTFGEYNFGQDIDLNGSIADYDGDMLWYTWLEGTTILASGSIATVIGGEPVVLPTNIISGGLPPGDHLITLEVSDGVHIVVADTNITVIDSLAPLMNPVSSQSMLWPVNGDLRTVTITTNATDNTGGAVMLNAEVTSNQPSPIDKDGNTIPDFTITNIDQTTGIVTSQLRASRAGYAGDRLYTVTIKGTDQAGNSSKSDVVIKVPHDNGRR